ncbi:MAG: hypothetical protein HGB34_00445 [Candidatus Moranbacteria bacterium]|nr:hypothetical protein [Candidatus Moranbacteria bacterium]
MKPTFTNIFPKGSVLVFSLIILSLMLVTSLTLLSSATLDRKASLSTGNSTRSFQVADSGIEQVLYQIYRQDHDTVADLADAISDANGCENGIISSDAGWQVAFYEGENGDTRITDCDDTDWRNRVTKIKSQGGAGSTTRAVEVAVAQESSDSFSVNGNEVTGLDSGRKYFVSVYGFLAFREGGGTKAIGPVRVTDCHGETLDQTFSGTVNKNYPDGEAPNNASLIVTAPSDGCIRGITDGVSAYHMTGFSLD